MLGVADRDGLIERLFGGMRPDEAMLDARRAPRAAPACRTGLISNSWGDGAATTARASTSCSTCS